MNLTDGLSLALVLVTLLLAIGTFGLARSTKGTLSEMRVDRSLAYRPVLDVTRHVRAKEGAGELVDVRNVGTGPAVGVRAFVALDEHAWALSPPQSLAANMTPGDDVQRLRLETVDFVKHAVGDPSEHEDLRFLATGAAHTGQADVALFCEDSLGTRYRFLVWRIEGWRVDPEPAGSSFDRIVAGFRTRAPDTWHPEDGIPIPSWASSEHLWEPNGPRETRRPWYRRS